MVSSEISEKNAKANAKTAIGNPFIRCLLVDNSPADIMVDDRIAKSFTNSLEPRLSAQCLITRIYPRENVTATGMPGHRYQWLFLLAFNGMSFPGTQRANVQRHDQV